MRMLAASLAFFLSQQCLAADLIGGGLKVLGVKPIDDTKVAITIQEENAAETFVVDCISATWGFEGVALKPVRANQRSQAIAERACRAVEFKSALVSDSGEWSSPFEQKPEPAKKTRPTWTVSEQVSSPQPWDKFPQNIFSNYTRQQYPRTFAEWGESGVGQIELLERQAAVHVSKSKVCSEVEYVGLSESRSHPPVKPVVFVDCANGNRFYIGAKELSIHPDSLDYRRTK